MSLKCDFCQRHSIVTQTRSHSNIATKRKSYVNLQSRKFGQVKVKVCTKCLKTLKTSFQG